MSPSSLSAPRPWLLGPARQLLAACALTLASGCTFDELDGNGERSDETRETAPFTRVRSDAELDVEVVQGDETSLTVSIDENLQEHVKTRVAEGVLYIETRRELGDVVDGPHVLLTVPELYAAKLAGSGELSLALEQPEQPLDLFLSGSGEISFRGHTAVVGAYLSGSGELRLEGQTGDVEMILSGSGSIRGQKLTADSAAIELSGSGDISAAVQSSVSVSLSGSGHIDLYGGASMDRYSKTGSGDVDQH